MNIRTILDHVRTICQRGIEVREVAVSEHGISLILDTRAGVPDNERVMLEFTIEDETILAKARTVKSGHFVAEWVVGNQAHQACWLAVMVNCTGYGDYWMTPLDE